jgi:serine acetyltransferase
MMPTTPSGEAAVPRAPARTSSPRPRAAVWPSAQLAAREIDFRQGHHRFGNEVLVRRAMAEVGADRRVHRIEAAREQMAQAAQVGMALFQARLVRKPGAAQAFEGRAEGHGRVGDIVHAASVCARRRRRATPTMRAYVPAPLPRPSARLGERVYVDPAASVIGDVVLGDDVSVWPFTVIRGDVNFIRIGARTNVQDGTVIHVSHDGPHAKLGGFATVIGSDVTIGHKAIVHACRIEDAVLIGMGAIVLDGAVVESTASSAPARWSRRARSSAAANCGSAIPRRRCGCSAMRNRGVVLLGRALRALKDQYLAGAVAP